MSATYRQSARLIAGERVLSWGKHRVMKHRSQSRNTHPHEMMEGLPVRMYTHGHHILKDASRLGIQTLLGTSLQQAVVCRPIWPDPLRLHALHDRKHCARLSAVEL